MGLQPSCWALLGEKKEGWTGPRKRPRLPDLSYKDKWDVLLPSWDQYQPTGHTFAISDLGGRLPHCQHSAHPEGGDPLRLEPMLAFWFSIRQDGGEGPRR